MEISKEKFIELFKDECSKSTSCLEDNSFDRSESVIRIVSTEVLSFCIIQTLKDTKTNNRQDCDCFGKIIFNGFVEYKNFDLTEKEYLELEDYFVQCEQEHTYRIKAQIIEKGESELVHLL